MPSNATVPKVVRRERCKVEVKDAYWVDVAVDEVHVADGHRIALLLARGSAASTRELADAAKERGLRLLQAATTKEKINKWGD